MTTHAYYALSKNTAEDSVILLIRHEERCERSGNPWLGPGDGIIVSGSGRAKEAEIRLNAYFIWTTPMCSPVPPQKTVQTAYVMPGRGSLLPDRKSTCGSDIVEKLLKRKTINRNLIVVTHNTCMKELV